mgnify:CR=1 FL=1
MLSRESVLIKTCRNSTLKLSKFYKKNYYDLSLTPAIKNELIEQIIIDKVIEIVGGKENLDLNLDLIETIDIPLGNKCVLCSSMIYEND